MTETADERPHLPGEGWARMVAYLGYEPEIDAATERRVDEMIERAKARLGRPADEVVQHDKAG